MQKSFYRTKISGTGSAVPRRRVTNYDLEKSVDTSHDWIVERTGIVERRISDGTPEEHNSSLAVRAAQQALKNSGVAASEIEMILVATVTPDHSMPNTACLVQHKLGIQKAAALDLSAACSGFVYGLSIADSLIRCGQFKHILLIGSEVLSAMVNWQDRNTCILFGDGSGAAVISQADAKDTSELLAHRIYADGSLHDLLTLPVGGGSAIPLTHETLDAGLHKIHMKGKEIFKVAVRLLADCLVETTEAAGFKISDLDWIIPHQANIRILEAVAKRLDFPTEKVIVNIDRFGNTSSASIPLALHESVQDGRIKRGDLVGFTVFGAGLTYGASVLRY